MRKRIVFIDTEVSFRNDKVVDFGAIGPDRAFLHTASYKEFASFISDAEYLCGHNIIHHDIPHIEKSMRIDISIPLIDTLYLSPLLFPKKPYHALVKDDKLQSDDLNNPFNDAKKALDLFYDELNAFLSLDNRLKRIFYGLLASQLEFKAFFNFIKYHPEIKSLDFDIKDYFNGKICINSPLLSLIKNKPVELAYALALIATDDYNSITPPWLLKNYPEITNVLKLLRHTPCLHCEYCLDILDPKKALNKYFGFSDFRTYNGEALQENAVRSALKGESLLAIFPTGGGKSLTFQLPALMDAETTRSLTVVISPLQSLMKDQVDNLASKGITSAVTINGLLDPIERADAIERLYNGSASLLYISPESLRSKTIEKILLSRNIARFVIDEAHCFSAWGQDFRVDYLFIGDFIHELLKKKGQGVIPISCFTATAKQKVISDIVTYFKKKLDLDLKLFASDATRENLHYTVLYKGTDQEKYNTLRDLILKKQCPTIVYVSRTRRTKQIAEKLCADGIKALPFNGKMDAKEKINNQEAFMNDKVTAIVATSAFGMGVDKKDVGLVVHYDISSSLEDYIQEAGRAGRDPKMRAECYVLFNENDLDKHFILLNQTKLSMSEIQQVFKAIKEMSKGRKFISFSALEIARGAGWDNNVNDVETRVKTALAALENAGYIKRHQNAPRIFATSILAKNMIEAARAIDRSSLMDETMKLKAKRIIKSLISEKNTSSLKDEAESRVDYLADILGIRKEDVIEAISLMRQEGILSDSHDMSAYIATSDTENKSLNNLENYAKLERFLLKEFSESLNSYNLKELNEKALNDGIGRSSIKNIRTLLYFLEIKNYISKQENSHNHNINIVLEKPYKVLVKKFEKRIELCRFIIEKLYDRATKDGSSQKDENEVWFSLVEIYNEFRALPRLDMFDDDISLKDVEDALLYLSKINSLRLEGGFLVLYNALTIERLTLNNLIKYKKEDYQNLDDFYKQKIRQIHIVGEYANLMVKDYEAALGFVHDYFNLDFEKFIQKYFKEDRLKEIDRNITPRKYKELFEELSKTQLKIISDDHSKFIVVAAGPGSGKTKVLVHKLASLLILEDIKHEQLLMLTFSRLAATEFKMRLKNLIGNATNYVEIKTFHSYCFDLLGKIGNLEGVDDVIKSATAMIRNGEVEQEKITKGVLVIDEAQDMNSDEFELVEALIKANDDMRVIAVGDDDQNIYEFRGSNSKYLEYLVTNYGATKYEMVDNYRSDQEIVRFANAFVKNIGHRMKQEPIKAIRQEAGLVEITRHYSRQMEEALLHEILKYHKSNAIVLTNTNSEALRITGLLNQNGIKARLIQSLDGINLINLIEIRYFLSIINKHIKTPLIQEKLWDHAKSELHKRYDSSLIITLIDNLLRTFEKTNPSLYYSDLKEFILESKLEDFYEIKKETVYVSTIHKAKGRQFDEVYLYLDDVKELNDKKARRLYVAITRAQKNLFIHTNSDLFADYAKQNFSYSKDYTNYDPPLKITVSLGYKDVYLDYFKDKKEIIKTLSSGMRLTAGNGCLSIRKIPLIKYSKSFKDRLLTLEKSGYHVHEAQIRFILAWKGENDSEECLIILPDITLLKD